MAYLYTPKTANLSKPHTNRVCFIGHRTIPITDELTAELTKIIERLIMNGTTIFNFGSHSQFDSLCYDIVTELQKQYPKIKRVHYCIPYENYMAAGINDLYEQEIDSDKAFQANKKSYMARNFEMIDNSELCIFFYDSNYQPPRRKNSKRDLTDYQAKSGTALAYEYASKKKKQIINLGGKQWTL